MHHNDTHLCITWQVRGEQLKAVHTQDLERVSADSCVEFFCQVEGDEHYFNFEFNCIGVMTASYRKGRAEDVRKLPLEDLSQILRYSSVGTEPFEERDGEHEWELSVQIPFDLLRKYSGKQEICSLRGNFYKCADDTKKKHYVSWNPIPTEKPDFHRPEYFGVITLGS